MPTVKFTYALKRFYPKLKPMEIEATDVRSVVEEVNNQFPGIKGYLLDDQGALRQHVNIFVDGSMVHDRDTLSDSLDDVDEVYIMQALSGG